MKNASIIICLSFLLIGCSNKERARQYPIIDMVGSIGTYQKVYCSDLFSSIELIPLETRSDCLLDVGISPSVLLKDGIILKIGGGRLYAFDSTGKFLNQIGERGQGIGEYSFLSNISFHTDRPTIYVSDTHHTLEYNFEGKFLRSFPIPRGDTGGLFDIAYIGDNLFVGHTYYNGKRKYKYGIFNQNGDIVKYFPSYISIHMESEWVTREHAALKPIRVDDKLYLKDYVNDTIYSLSGTNLQPAYTFEFGKYAYPIERLEVFNSPKWQDYFTIRKLVGTPNFFFYEMRFPDSLSKPKSKPVYNPIIGKFRTLDATVYGIYNIQERTNTFLDTDRYLQKGIVNDINGGLPFIPRYYAGNGVVVDVWNAEDMKEMLTEEYFASQQIKDSQSHQRLKDLLKNLKEDDNPVIVVAKLK